MFYIYIITNKLNNKSYIGQTKNISYRFKSHKTNYKYKYKSNALYKAFNKYNIENFTFQIIEENTTREETNEAEMFYIQLFQTLAPNGYNISPGGNASSPTLQTKEKIKKTLKEKSHLLNVSKFGKDHPRYGHKHSPEIREKINKQISGQNCKTSKITKEIAIYIYSLAYIGLSVSQIKQLCNLKSSAIHNIINKKSWKEDLTNFANITTKPNGHNNYKLRIDLLNKIKANELEVPLPPLTNQVHFIQ